MKQLFFTLLFLLSAVSIYSQSDIKVFTQEGEPFFLIIDGERMNEVAQTKVEARNLITTGVRMKAIFEDKSLGSVDKIFPMEPYNLYSFNVKRNKKGKYVMRILSVTPLDAPAPPPPPVAAAPAPVRTAPVVATTTTTTTTTNTENVSLGMNVDGFNISVNTSAPGIGTAHQTHSVTTTTSGDIHGHAAPAAPVSYVDGYTGPIGCPVPMDSYKYGDIQRGVESTPFAGEKKDKLKSYMSNQCMTSGQARSIVSMYTHAFDKLEIAKYLYSHTHDIGNYYQVGEVLDFDSHKKELDSFIAGQR